VVEILRGVVPFLLADRAVVALIATFPAMVLFLPDLLG
jgi:TRAP-type mannitol/chloroaromatic compound transport system permease large subunit